MRKEAQSPDHALRRVDLIQLTQPWMSFSLSLFGCAGLATDVLS